MAQHWRAARSTEVRSPDGARRGMLLIAGLVVAGLLAMHFLAPSPVWPPP
jgi:hypothetical protein